VNKRISLITPWRPPSLKGLHHVQIALPKPWALSVAQRKALWAIWQHLGATIQRVYKEERY